MKRMTLFQQLIFNVVILGFLAIVVYAVTAPHTKESKNN